MQKTALRPIQELYLNSNYEVITNKTKELPPTFTLRFRYKEGKIYNILVLDSHDYPLCVFSKNDIENINLNRLRKTNLSLSQEKIKEYSQNSVEFKREFMKIFFYKKFITQEF